MKKKVKYFIVGLVIVGISFLYAHIDKNIAIYDKTLDTSIYGNMGELTQGLTVSQEFIAERSVLDGITLKLATYGNTLTSTYYYRIIEEKSGQTIREGKINAAKVGNGKYYSIDFDQITDCKNQMFVFTLESPDAEPGNALTVYNVPKGQEDVDLKLNSDDFENNTLAMRTVSHLFDWETFFSVIFTLSYLYVFIVVLFKFFR